jgi:heme oxygenase
MAGVLVVCNGVALGQTPGKPTFPKPPTPGDPQEKNKTADASDLKAMKRAAMVRNEKEFRAGVERLYQLSGDLREEMQKTTTTNVLSVQMYKKTEEIEKLAKRLKNLAKGS